MKKSTIAAIAALAFAGGIAIPTATYAWSSTENYELHQALQCLKFAKHEIQEAFKSSGREDEGLKDARQATEEAIDKVQAELEHQ